MNPLWLNSVVRTCKVVQIRTLPHLTVWKLASDLVPFQAQIIHQHTSSRSEFGGPTGQMAPQQPLVFVVRLGEQCREASTKPRNNGVCGKLTPAIPMLREIAARSPFRARRRERWFSRWLRGPLAPSPRHGRSLPDLSALRCSRWWARCACSRRVAKLYLPRNATNFRCRHCHQLRYRSQRMTLDARWENRANRIVRRLGGEAADGNIYKPKWMCWATFTRIMDDVRDSNNAAFGYRIRGLMKPHSWLSRSMRRRRASEVHAPRLLERL